MADPTQDKLTDHEYDGIREYDNPTPGWWTWLFIGSIFFAIGYWMVFHFGTIGWTVEEALADARAENLRLQFGELGVLEPTAENVLRYMNDEKWKGLGETVFRTHCVACHGPDGGGKEGPNLHDDFWKNVKQVQDIPQVVTNGAAGGNMPPWRTRLHPNEIVLVSSYVAAMRGRAVEEGTPKDPEGEPIPPWPAPPADAAGAAAPVDGGGDQ